MCTIQPGADSQLILASAAMTFELSAAEPDGSDVQFYQVFSNTQPVTPVYKEQMDENHQFVNLTLAPWQDTDNYGYVVIRNVCDYPIDYEQE